jgi:hypothetical protein
MNAYSKGGVEPPLRDVIREPIVRTLMTRDGIREADLIGLLSIAKRRCDAAGGACRESLPRGDAAVS